MNEKPAPEAADDLIAVTAAHPKSALIEALADAMHSIEDDDGNGRHISYYRSLAFATVEILPALFYDEDALCDEPGCGAHPEGTSMITTTLGNLTAGYVGKTIYVDDYTTGELVRVTHERTGVTEIGIRAGQRGLLTNTTTWPSVTPVTIQEETATPDPDSPDKLDWGVGS